MNVFRCIQLVIIKWVSHPLSFSHLGSQSCVCLKTYASIWKIWHRQCNTLSSCCLFCLIFVLVCTSKYIDIITCILLWKSGIFSIIQNSNCFRWSRWFSWFWSKSWERFNILLMVLQKTNCCLYIVPHLKAMNFSLRFHSSKVFRIDIRGIIFLVGVHFIHQDLFYASRMMMNFEIQMTAQFKLNNVHVPIKY